MKITILLLISLFFISCAHNKFNSPRSIADDGSEVLPIKITCSSLHEGSFKYVTNKHAIIAKKKRGRLIYTCLDNDEEWKECISSELPRSKTGRFSYYVNLDLGCRILNHGEYMSHIILKNH